MNRTGMGLVPERLDAMVEGTEQFPPAGRGPGDSLASVRVEYAKDGEPVGSIPPPAGMKDVVKTAAKAVLGKQPTLFLDKLGERLAFERSGVRLYDALLSKHDAYGAFRGGPARHDLEHLRDEERAHFMMLHEVVDRRGGDPTAITPSADVHATLAKGVVAVLADPRTDLVQSLEGILLAELADNDCWTALVALARADGDDELAGRFEEAERTEREHLARVRGWIAAAQGRTDRPAAHAPDARAGRRTARRRRAGTRRAQARRVSGSAPKKRKRARTR
jgi:hypothetical protein